MVKFIELTKIETDTSVCLSVDKITSVVSAENDSCCFVEIDFDKINNESIGFYVKEPYDVVANMLFNLYKCESN